MCKNNKLVFIVSVIAAASSSSILAEDCSGYPYERGMDASSVPGSVIPRILYTARAIPFSDDLDDVVDAYDEAELKAKAGISSYLSELISSKQSRDELVEKITKQNGNNKEKSKEGLETVIKGLSSESQAMLRGVVTLGDCYTPGTEVRVTVGIKPETIAQAAGLASGIDSSLQSSPTPGKSSGGTEAEKKTGDNLKRTDGHSNTKRLRDF